MRFFTSDHHFWHSKVLFYCPRPYATLEEMHAGLIKEWNDAIRPEDEVFHTGDFCFGGAPKTREILAQLNGTKHLIIGNHDFRGNLKQAAKCGWASIHEQLELSLADQADVLLCHYPYRFDHTTDVRYLDRRPKDTNKWLIHGHVHNSWKVREKMINVGVDVWDMKPVSEEQICNLILSKA